MVRCVGGVGVHTTPCFSCTPHRKLVSKGCWEWCYTSVYSLLKKAASEATKENVGVSMLRQKTVLIFVYAASPSDPCSTFCSA